jgi:excisionase family DNA binding protein
MKDAYTIREVAQRLDVAEATVRRLVREGDLPSIRISPRRIIIPVSALEAWLHDRANQGA